jgi:hypothetical protein
MKGPWTTEKDPSENSELIRIYFFEKEAMFGMGSTMKQHEMVVKNLNISYQKGLKDACK